MTIEISKLKKMLHLEAAAVDWWGQLSKKEQQAYVKAHPKSKYAVGGASGTSHQKKVAQSLKGLGMSAKMFRNDDRSPAFQDFEPNRSKKARGEHIAHKDVHSALISHGFKKTAEGQYSHPAGNKATISKGRFGVVHVRHYLPKDEAAIRDSNTKALDKALKSGTSTIPTISSATKSSNHVVKNYGGERLRNFSSNPYSDSQSFTHRVSGANAEKLKKDLRSQGWEERPLLNYSKDKDPTHDGKSFRYTHPNGGSIDVRHGVGTKGPYVHVTTNGKKKAKQSNLPLYD